MQIRVGDRVFDRDDHQRRGDLCATRGTVIAFLPDQLAVIDWDHAGTDSHPVAELERIASPHR
ncbi:hypothetical protein Athai_60610 [Actinocatenispora thailandica]|uniref:DUF1918 domain-containing protein n=1 Tax=Actinocatenispora thailandica TaxID=227318 RepID=A0A7R7I0Z5_9ACTN|nr:hypothetical protein Athai_60610 [Actinocatenispora thailandica]